MEFRNRSIYFIVLKKLWHSYLSLILLNHQNKTIYVFHYSNPERIPHNVHYQLYSPIFKII